MKSLTSLGTLMLLIVEKSVSSSISRDRFLNMGRSDSKSAARSCFSEILRMASAVL